MDSYFGIFCEYNFFIQLHLWSRIYTTVDIHYAIIDKASLKCNTTNQNDTRNHNITH